MTVETFRRVQAIPTTYRGVDMRSQLEARVAKALDEAHIPWIYEPRKFWIPGQRHTGYLPDFALWPRRRHPWIVEVKPTGIYDERNPDPTDLWTARDRLLIVWKLEPTATLLLWVADSRHPDLGSVLIRTPRSDRWVEQPALPWLRQQRPWWRRLFGR